MLIFPIDNLLDEAACCALLLEGLHPEGLRCPNEHPLEDGQGAHDRHRAPVLDYRCHACGAVFNLFTGTFFSGTRYKCSTLVLLLRGIAQGVPTAHLARELSLDRSNILTLRHELQALVEQRFSPLWSSGRGGGGRRDVPERGGEGRKASRSRRPPS